VATITIIKDQFNGKKIAGEGAPGLLLHRNATALILTTSKCSNLDLNKLFESRVDRRTEMLI
jgi:hypothetical protein